MWMGIKSEELEFFDKNIGDFIPQYSGHKDAFSVSSFKGWERESLKKEETPFL